jgi:integrase
MTTMNIQTLDLKDPLIDIYDPTIEGNPREGYAIPIQELRNILKFLKYNRLKHHQTNYMMTLWAILTGCRLKELENMTSTAFKGHWFFWKKGKNQKGYRKAYIPDYALKEMQKYRNSTNVPRLKLFPKNTDSYRRQMNSIRKKLSIQWNKHIDAFEGNKVSEDEYELQLKGFRKTFATFTFFKFYKEFNSYEVAYLMTCKEFGHGSKHMTADHYIEEKKRTDILQYIDNEWWELFKI